MPELPTLRLGITMAGAVSAGAYTAGAMDYLIQTLNRWQLEKEKGTALAPKHSVMIDVLGGTSAGGISAALAAMSLYQDHQCIDCPDPPPSGTNLLYQSWVDLVDDPGKDNSFLKMLDPGDIQPGGKISSLLNSNFIETISRNAIDGFRKKSLPDYVSPDFELLLTLSNLRGVPFDVSFNSDQEHRRESPTHSMAFHKMYTHFRTNASEDIGDSYFRLDFTRRADIERLIEFAKATSAFPVGLKPRQIRHMRSKFVLATLAKFLNPALLEKELIKFRKDLPETYGFTAVDGGAFNNEPFTEVGQLLERRRQESDDPAADCAIMMIDPFPSFQHAADTYSLTEFLPGSAFGVVGALRNQAMFKEADLLGISESSFKQNMIYPVRYSGPQTKATGTPIACGALGGFSGFFRKEFRVHDYFLGRDNCRNFLRYIFSYSYPLIDGQVPKDRLRAIHRDWTDDMIATFGKRSADKKLMLLPIIPDFTELDDEHQPDAKKYWQHTYSRFPSIPVQEILNLKEPIIARATSMIESFLEEPPAGEQDLDKGTPQNKDDLLLKAEKIIESEFKTSFLGNATVRVVKYLFGKKVIQAVAETATKLVLKSIVTDFVKMGLIREKDLS